MKVKVNGFEYETDKVEIVLNRGTLEIYEDCVLSYERGVDPSDGAPGLNNTTIKSLFD